MKNKVKILIENILKESVENQPEKAKIKLGALWQDRKEKRLKQFEKILSQETINGDLYLEGSPIENLGNIKHVKGNLKIQNCPNIISLSKELIIDGALIITYCPKLKSFPERLIIKGKLFISSLPLLKLGNSKIICEQEITVVKCYVDLINEFEERYSIIDFMTIYK